MVGNNEVIGEDGDYWILAHRYVYCPNCGGELETYKSAWYCKTCEKEMIAGKEHVEPYHFPKSESDENLIELKDYIKDE